MGKLVPHIPTGDWVALRRALNKIASVKLGPGAIITFLGMILTELTASRLIATNASKRLVSTDANSWVSGTANEIEVIDDGDGTITLSLLNTFLDNIICHDGEVVTHDGEVVYLE